MAQENRSWGYDRIVGALANLGLTVSAQTVGNILKRHGIPPVPERKTTTTWKAFIRTHLDVLVATDFFTAEVWTLGGLVTYDVLFFLHLGSRQIHVAGVTPHPDEAWMLQVARNVTMEEWGFLAPGQYRIHDRDTKCCAAFQHLIDDAGVERVVLPPRSPNLNAYAERWVRSVKEECLSRLPARTAQAFMLREHLGFETDEICKELGVTPTHCWVLLYRARMALRLCLQQNWFGR